MRAAAAVLSTCALLGAGLAAAPAAGATTPKSAPARVSSADQTRIKHFSAELRKIRTCESSGNYRINTGNGYYGAYQFSLATWHGLGYSGYPNAAAPKVQDAAAAKLLSRAPARRNWGYCG